MSRLALSLAFALTLAACGGGGGDAAPNTAGVPAPPAALPIKAFATSYENAKLQGLSRIAFPASLQTFVPDQPLAWGAADFFQRGNIDIFTAKQNYNLSFSYATVTSDAKYLSDFQFWRRLNDGSLSLAASYKGCLHPRKAVVADFNRDGYPDVFVACHGYDAQVNGRMVGEKSKLLLNDGKGGFVVTDATDLGFYHGASAADVNGDGYPDIVVANIMNSGGPNVHFLMNQKDGTFKVENARVPGQVGGPFFSVELLDVNGDGILDLAVGGHEADMNASSAAETAVLYGDASGKFGATKTVITKIAGRGVVVDFTLVTNNGKKVLYVDRTADGSVSAFPFYSTTTLQAIDLSTNASTLMIDQARGWVPWWLPATRNGQNGVSPFRAADPDLFFSQ